MSDHWLKKTLAVSLLLLASCSRQSGEGVLPPENLFQFRYFENLLAQDEVLYEIKDGKYYAFLEQDRERIEAIAIRAVKRGSKAIDINAANGCELSWLTYYLISNDAMYWVHESGLERTRVEIAAEDFEDGSLSAHYSTLIERCQNSHDE